MKKTIAMIVAAGLMISSTATAFASTSMWTTANLRARTAPSLKAEIYDVLPTGSKVNCIKKGKHWNTVLINGKKCYMYNYYLSNRKVEKQDNSSIPNAIYSASSFRSRGVIYWNGWRWTWYSQRVLPGGGLRIPGRHVGANGYVMDGNGKICLASSSLSKGTVVSTPFGAEGYVYDSGCASDTLDVYVAW